MSPKERFQGLLVGTALGDSVGLPAEGLGPSQIRKLGWDRNWQQRFLFGRGMWSDDTEHTLILAQALLSSDGDLKRFQKKLARGLKLWLLALPAGVGMATARSLCKLWLGFPPHRAGVFSAGNGPAMRAALLGAYFWDHSGQRREFNRVQTQLTHTDPKTEFASLAVVELTAFFCRESRNPNQEELHALLCEVSADGDWRKLVDLLKHHLESRSSFDEFLTALGGHPAKGISGYCYQTVPAVIFLAMKMSWETKPALESVWNAGGDTDTTGAIAGALCGCLQGADSFPSQWSNHLAEWPTSLNDFDLLSEALAQKTPCKIRKAFHPLLLARNLLFLATVLVHGFARIRLRCPRSQVASGVRD